MRRPTTVHRLFTGAIVLAAVSSPAPAVCPGGGNCNGHGTCIGGTTCACFTGYSGIDCGQCAANYYNYPTCAFCTAAGTCNGHGTCSATGSCICSTGYVGANCDQCAPNYYNYPTCTFCLASTTCSGNGTCNTSGGCDCFPGWTGANCATPAVPSIIAWSSRCDTPCTGWYWFPLPLDPIATGNGIDGPTVETRDLGIQLIVVHFNRGVTLVDPAEITVIGRTTTNGSMGSPVSYIPSSIGAGAEALYLHFVPGFLPDQTCYEITIGAAALAEGITGDNTVSLRALVGDATGSGDVTLSDAIYVAAKAAAGTSAVAAPHLDIDFSGGMITLPDALAAKAQVTSPARNAMCP